MRRPLLAALAAATAFTLSLGLPAFAQEHHDEHHEGHAQGQGGHPAPPPSQHAQPAPARPAFVPQARPSGPPQGAPQFDRGRFGGPPPASAQHFDQGRFGGEERRSQFGQPRVYQGNASLPPAYRGYDQSQGGYRPGYVGDRAQGEANRGRPGFIDNGAQYGGGGGARSGFDNRQQYQGGRQGFVASGQGGGDRGRFEGGHDHGRDFEHERNEYAREHVDFRRFGGDPDRYRHDYAYREWRGREYDPIRLQIINEYGYRPFGYGLGYGFNAGIGWGFDLRFGYWYGPRYYDPGYEFWYGPQTFYRYGVPPEELILRDSRLYNWALRWFDYDQDGYLERNEVVDAARAFRRFADFDGNGNIDGREYRYALERIDGFQPQGY